MKKKTLTALLILLSAYFAFAESIHSISLATGYKGNSFEYEKLNFDSNIWRLSAGYSYQVYPSYDSFFGFMINPNFGFDIPFKTQIKNNGSKSKINSDYELDMLFPVFFNTNVALNFRIPGNLEKGFPYVRLGTTWQVSFFKIKEKADFAPDSVSGKQQNLSAFFEIGFQPRHYEDYQEKDFDSFFSYYRSDISIRFIYDFLVKNPPTDNGWININNFGIILIWKPYQRACENKRDKFFISDYKEKRKRKITEMQNSEDRYSKAYRLFEEQNCKLENIDYLTMKALDCDIQFENSFFNIPIKANFYRRRNKNDTDWMEFSEPFLRDISFIKHELGSGKPGSDDYITLSTKTVTLPFYTEEEKLAAFNALLTEYNTRKEQKARIAENRHLNPDNYDYQNLPVLSMATMGVKYAPNPSLIPGKVYIADQLRLFYIINSMDNGDYNIGQEASVYGTYQFILKNSSGEAMSGIGGHMFADTAYLRYLGTTKVVMSNGYERWLPYFEMIKKNPHISNVAKIVRECEEW